MSLSLYLDDCAFDKVLRDILRAPPFSHRVVTPMDAGTLGARDSVHFAYAVEYNLVLVTKNPDDFLTLAEANPNHAGLFLIYQDNRLSEPTAIGDCASNIQR